MLIKIPLDKGWLPDYLPFAMPEGGLLEAKNLLPYDEYYAPALGKVVYSSNALTGTPKMGIEFKDANGVRYVFIGTTTKLYRLETNKSLTDVSKALTDYGTGSNRWDFAQYGQTIIATNFAYAPQILKPALTSANFADLGGTPPKAKYCLFHAGHLILGHLNEAGVTGPKKLAWSALENVESWTVSLTTGADVQDIADADGEMTGLANVGSIFGIFFRNSISVGWLAGAPFTYNFATNKVKNVGAIPGTVISIGDVAFFWGDKDIYVFDGETATPIGMGMRKSVLDSLNSTYEDRITTGHDLKRGIIYWAYPTTQSSDGTPDRILCYNYKVNRWTHIDVSLNCIFPLYIGTGYTMDNIDSIYPSLDTIPYSLDSNFWLANSPVLGGVGTDGKVFSFTGGALTGVLETGEFANGSLFVVQRVRPKVEKAVETVSVRIGSRLIETAGRSYSDPATVGSNGYADMRRTGRYLTCELTTGAHGGINSLEVEAVEAGLR